MEKLTPLLSWSAPSHPKHDRTARWYIVFFIILLGFAGYGAYTANWTFAILILLCGLLYPLLHDHIPPEKRLEIHQQGFIFESTLIRWEDCICFWIIETPTYAELHIEYTEDQRRREVKILNGGADPMTIRLQLAAFIPELPDHGEGFLDTLIRICKL